MGTPSHCSSSSANTSEGKIRPVGCLPIPRSHGSSKQKKTKSRPAAKAANVGQKAKVRPNLKGCNPWSLSFNPSPP